MIYISENNGASMALLGFYHSSRAMSVFPGDVAMLVVSIYSLARFTNPTKRAVLTPHKRD